MGNENTHIANACTGEIQVFYNSNNIRLDEIATDITNEGTKTLLVIKPDNRIRHLKCGSRQVANIAGQGSLYITVTCNRGSKDEVLCHNLFVPIDRSIIAINNGMVKFAKYGSLWQDEEQNIW
ncbi:hypothetical protein GDO81_028449 [Engystomops pustulosus]|uniref:Uncharacterized protein n=1 Tax=Engystomops pustulosus TaxID=76066 RepID=A0AAV6ZL65_ENGPU|nr:hypothetical protein GDO81_028449 [Engystomops pustulosus]